MSNKTKQNIKRFHLSVACTAQSKHHYLRHGDDRRDLYNFCTSPTFSQYNFSFRSSERHNVIHVNDQKNDTSNNICWCECAEFSHFNTKYII